jgi:hypothetical protein
LHAKKKEVRKKIYRKSFLERKIKFAVTRKESEELCEIFRIVRYLCGGRYLT